MSDSLKIGRGLVLGQPLPKRHLDRIIKLQNLKADWVREHMVEHPEPEAEDVDLITDWNLGQNFPQLGSGFTTDFTQFRKSSLAKSGGKKSSGKGGKGKGKGAQGGGGKGQKWPDPKVVHQIVTQMFANVPVAGMEGNLQIGETNMEFWTLSKAKFFELAAKEMLRHFHLMFVEETAKDGLQYTGQNCGYGYFCSPENNRQQAVGFWVHPRLRVIGAPIRYDSVANVQGIPSLRPGWRLDLEDKTTGEKFSVVVLHLKSMIGGPKVTSVIRYAQFQALANDLGTEFNGIVGGDLNYPMADPTFKDADPLVNAGFTMVEPNDKRGTQVMGPTRIDGFFVRGLNCGVDYYNVFPYFANKTIGRGYTDHASLYFEYLVASKQANGSAIASVATPSHLVGGANLPPLKLTARSRRGK